MFITSDVFASRAWHRQQGIQCSTFCGLVFDIVCLGFTAFPSAIKGRSMQASVDFHSSHEHPPQEPRMVFVIAGSLFHQYHNEFGSSQICSVASLSRDSCRNSVPLVSDSWRFGQCIRYSTSSAAQGRGGSFRIGNIRRAWLFRITDGRGIH